MRGWWREITGLVLPVACSGCGTPRALLCEECGLTLYGGAARRTRPVPEPVGLPVVHAAAPYEDAVRAVLLAHKERGALGLARPLGVALAGAVRASVSQTVGAAAAGSDQAGRTPAEAAGPLLLVPVPSAPRAVRARGHDAARRIALAAAGELRRTGIEARALPVLRQRRAVADQSGLTARQRMVNLAEALEVVRGGSRLLEGGRAVLVDDLMTTGASLAEAARALRAAMGLRSPAFVQLCAAVVAAPPLALQPIERME
jgi:predicted amidophosphoribosyltransferase